MVSLESQVSLLDKVALPEFVAASAPAPAVNFLNSSSQRMGIKLKCSGGASTFNALLQAVLQLALTNTSAVCKRDATRRAGAGEFLKRSRTELEFRDSIGRKERRKKVRSSHHRKILTAGLRPGTTRHSLCSLRSLVANFGFQAETSPGA